MRAETKQPAERRSQADIAYATLRTQIVRCELLPGAHLTESELVSRLGLGRTPIREALVRLGHDGMVEALPRAGHRVKSLSRKSIEDFYTAWLVAVQLVTRLAFSKMDEDGRQRLQQVGLDRLRISDADVWELAALARRFFDTLADLADNAPLAFIIGRLGAEMERLYILHSHTPEGRSWIANSKELLAFASIRDPQRAAEIIREHTLLARVDILLAIDADRAGSGSGT